jgi:hypothetical protein
MGEFNIKPVVFQIKGGDDHKDLKTIDNYIDDHFATT